MDARTTLERENVRLRRAVAELAVLNELAGEIGVMREPERVMDAIVRRATEAAGAEQGLITLVDTSRADVQQTLVRGTAPVRETDRFHVPMQMLGWMHHHKRALAIEPKRPAELQDVAWHPAVQSLLLVPLLAKGALTGILAVFNKRDAAGFDDDDQRLLSILAGQSAQVLENARLWGQEQDLLRLQSELNVAAAIQARLLPTRLPELPGYTLAAGSTPAEAVGGDFFDVIEVGARRVALYLGDVSGKGLPAALTMANAQALLHSLIRWGLPLGEALSRASQMLYESTDARTFVTLFACVLDADRHTLTYANAGHPRPLLASPGQPPRPLGGGSLALGLRPGTTYEAATCPLAPGEVLLLYSDGATEAMSPQRDLYGEERLAHTLAECLHESAADIHRHTLSCLHAHVAGAIPSDDLTLLLVKRL